MIQDYKLKHGNNNNRKLDSKKFRSISLICRQAVSVTFIKRTIFYIIFCTCIIFYWKFMIQEILFYDKDPQNKNKQTNNKKKQSQKQYPNFLSYVSWKNCIFEFSIEFQRNNLILIFKISMHGPIIFLK